MSDFKAKMHQICFLLGLCPGTPGELTPPPTDTLVVFKGSTSNGTEGKEKGGEEEWKKR